jgi:hypothetical protein
MTLKQNIQRTSEGELVLMVMHKRHRRRSIFPKHRSRSMHHPRVLHRNLRIASRRLRSDWQLRRTSEIPTGLVDRRGVAEDRADIRGIRVRGDEMRANASRCFVMLIAVIGFCFPGGRRAASHRMQWTWFHVQSPSRSSHLYLRKLIPHRCRALLCASD